MSDQGLESLRHTCKDEHLMERWGWTSFIPGQYGKQQISDSTNNVVCAMYSSSIRWFQRVLRPQMLNTSWVMRDGGDWALRVEGSSLTEEEAQHVSLFFYVSTSDGTIRLGDTGETQQSLVCVHALNVRTPLRQLQGLTRDVVLFGESASHGSFGVSLAQGTHAY